MICIATSPVPLLIINLHLDPAHSELHKKHVLKQIANMFFYYFRDWLCLVIGDWNFVQDPEDRKRFDGHEAAFWDLTLATHFESVLGPHVTELFQADFTHITRTSEGTPRIVSRIDRIFTNMNLIDLSDRDAGAWTFRVGTEIL